MNVDYNSYEGKEVIGIPLWFSQDGKKQLSGIRIR